MRNISFALTKPQFLDGSKDVTRRLGPLQVMDVTRQPLQLMIDHAKWGDEEAVREGFPELGGRGFVEMFCDEMKVLPAAEVTRIEFRRFVWMFVPFGEEAGFHHLEGEGWKRIGNSGHGHVLVRGEAA